MVANGVLYICTQTHLYAIEATSSDEERSSSVFAVLSWRSCTRISGTGTTAGLVFGFMPVGLVYHACYSLVAAAFWAFVIKFAWPSEIVAWAESEDEGGDK